MHESHQSAISCNISLSFGCLNEDNETHSTNLPTEKNVFKHIFITAFIQTNMFISFQGIFISRVNKGGASEKAGIHVGDRLLEVGGESFFSCF